MQRRILLFLLLLFFTAGINAFGGEGSRGNIHPNFRLSFSERLRLVTWDNTITLNDDANAGQTFTRHRTSIGGAWFPCKKSELMVKVTNEFRYYFAPTDREFDINEVFVDQLYLKYNTEDLIPGVFTVGRQNIMLGEGFIVMDGHPLDGSRSIYFNAVRYDWAMATEHKATFFYSYQDRTDQLLPVINSLDQELVDQKEEGYGVYYTGGYAGIGIQGYYIRKNNRANSDYPVRMEINTFGGRGQVDLAENLSVTGEGALEFGKHGMNDLLAFGGYVHADYKTGLGSYLPESVQLGGIFLSGDDPDTPKHEGWDPMFARWPKWSESYIYTQILEDGVAYWTNLASVYSRINFEFTPRVSGNFDYYHLMAPMASDPFQGFPGGGGQNRGDLIIGQLKFRIDKNLTGHLLWEGFIPGSYYFCGADGYSWVRAEFMYRIG